jgi:hypothetical protein
MTQLTELEVRRLLAAAMAYDNRKPGESTVLAWSEAARRERWTFDAALDAVHAHYAESTAYLMPGHITQRIRLARPSVPAYTPPALEAPPAAAETRESVMAEIRQFARRVALPRHVRGRRPATNSADHAAARERARTELDRVRDRATEPPAEGDAP